MALSVTPLKNHLATCATAYLVHSSCSDTVEYSELVNIMAKGRTTLTKPDIAGCIQLFLEEIEKLVADGKFVKTPLGSFYLCASGKMETPDQAFTPGEGENDHSIRLHFRADRAIEADIQTMAKIERRQRFDRNAPLVFGSKSVKTDADMKASVGDFIRVVGQRLKFDKANETEGLFFVNGAEHRSTQYAEVMPGLIIAEVPPGIAAGTYNLVVRSRQGGKDLHEGRHPQLFTIE